MGSLATGQVSNRSDIDLTVRGCSKSVFFFTFWADFVLELGHPVDMVNLDSQDAFARYLEEKKELLRVS